MTKIQQLTLEFGEYLKDESRSCGHADTISFPRTTDDVRQVLAELAGLDEERGTCTPVCVQGGRTGLAAGAVPASGHVMNLSKMNAYLGMRACDDGRGATRLFVRVQPGLVLSQLRSDLADKNIPCTGFDDASMAAWRAFQEGPEVFFPTDPTEVSATIGGMVACNASGARSYRYGAVRPHVSALRVVLADGQTLALTRGQVKEHDGVLSLTTEQGSRIEVPVPAYTMPSVKNASGYYAAPGMDAVDLFVGSDGTLGVICEIELELLAAPAVTWGVSCFFEQERQAMDFTCAARERITCASAMEFFDEAALAILAHQRTTSRAFATLPVTPEGARCCIFVELVCQSEDKAYEELWEIADLMEQVGADESRTWVARTDLDREAQRFFRHAVPESVNMLIDERRKTPPSPSSEATCPCPTHACTRSCRCTAPPWPRQAWRAPCGATSATTTCMSTCFRATPPTTRAARNSSSRGPARSPAWAAPSRPSTAWARSSATSSRSCTARRLSTRWRAPRSPSTPAASWDRATSLGPTRSTPRSPPMTGRTAPPKGRNKR